MPDLSGAASRHFKAGTPTQAPSMLTHSAGRACRRQASGFVLSAGFLFLLQPAWRTVVLRLAGYGEHEEDCEAPHPGTTQ